MGGELPIIRISVQAETAEEYIGAAMVRFGEEFFVATNEDVGERVRVEAPFLGGAVGVRGEALATPAVHEGRKGYFLRMVDLDRDSVMVMIPGPPDEPAPAPALLSPLAPRIPSSRTTPPLPYALIRPAKPAPIEDAQPTPVAEATKPAPIEEVPSTPIAEATQPEVDADAAVTVTPTPVADAPAVAVAPAPVADAAATEPAVTPPADIADEPLPAVEAVAADTRPRRRVVAVLAASVAIVAIAIFLVAGRSPRSTPSVARTHMLDAAPAVEPPPPPQPPVVEHKEPVEVPIIHPPGFEDPKPPPRVPVPPAPIPPTPKTPARPAAPKSLSPRDNARISCKFGTEIELVWVAVPGATGYVVEIARDASFSAIATTLETDTTVGVFRPLAPGNFLWRVTARGTNDTQSEPGGIRRFTCTAD